MSTRFLPTGKKTRNKTVRETTEFSEHRCGPACLNPPPRPTPKNLRRVSLGYIYNSDEGFFVKRGKNDWLPVVGLTFCGTPDGRLVKMFEPAIQLHIHSPGGRTYAKAVKEKEIKVDEVFHAREAARKLKPKVSNLREAQNFLDAEVARIIPHAPKSRKQPKGTGRGAPGEPRSDFSRAVIRLFNEDVAEKNAVQMMLEWIKNHENSPHKTSVRKLVRRWYSELRKKPRHK
jgi:hypothetical protein